MLTDLNSSSTFQKMHKHKHFSNHKDILVNTTFNKTQKRLTKHNNILVRTKTFKNTTFCSTQHLKTQHLKTQHLTKHTHLKTQHSGKHNI